MTISDATGSLESLGFTPVVRLDRWNRGTRLQFRAEFTGRRDAAESIKILSTKVRRAVTHTSEFYVFERTFVVPRSLPFKLFQPKKGFCTDNLSTLADTLALLAAPLPECSCSRPLEGVWPHAPFSPTGAKMVPRQLMKGLGQPGHRRIIGSSGADKGDPG